MSRWLLILDWTFIVIIGVPGALAALFTTFVFLFRKNDAGFMGIAGIVGLILGWSGLLLAGALALGLWGMQRGASWAPAVHWPAFCIAALLGLMVLAMVLRRR